MTRRTRQPQPLTAFPLNSGLLQRKCNTCDQRTIAGEECPKCQKKRQSLQRRAIKPVESSKVPTINQEKSSFSNSLLTSTLSLKRRTQTAIPPILQAKLTVGQANDPYEQEADHVAEQVMGMPEPLVQRQTPEEEEELTQTKPLAETITPLVQRQTPEEEEEELLQRQEEEEEEKLQAKAASPQTPEVAPKVEARIQSMRGSGHPLAEPSRAFFEPRFGTDFSGVRLHTDSTADSLNRTLNARAFTIGQDVFFLQGEYDSGSPKGKELLAHELTHVVQQGKKQIGEGQINRWSAQDHGKITKEVIKTNFSKHFSAHAKEMTAYYSGIMDIRGCNYLWYVPSQIPSQIPIVGSIQKLKPYYKLSESEAPNHGEANIYQYQNKTHLNDQRMKEYTEKAIKIGNEEGINDQSILELGMAIHVGQDRGAHEEGLPGKGHARKHDETGKKWDADDLFQNTKGADIAKDHSRNIINAFISGLNEETKTQLKYSGLSTKTIGEGAEFSLAMALSEEKPIFYAGLMKYKLMPEHRLFGIFSPILKSGWVLSGGEKGFGSILKVEAGLRLLRVTPRIYVDVLGGGFAGVGFPDQQIMAGISATVQAHYTGKEADFGLMLSKIYDRVGDKDVLVIGVSGRFGLPHHEEKEPLQRQADEKEEELQTKIATPEVALDVEARIQSQRDSGHPLPEPTRAFFEPRFGADFSGVRLHTDSEADQFNRTLNARAFTTGQDVFFRQGEYEPGSSRGKALLAHELTHVIQQEVTSCTKAASGQLPLSTVQNNLSAAPYSTRKITLLQHDITIQKVDMAEEKKQKYQEAATKKSEEIQGWVDQKNPEFITFSRAVTLEDAVRYIWPLMLEGERAGYLKDLRPVEPKEQIGGRYTHFWLPVKNNPTLRFWMRSEFTKAYNRLLGPVEFVKGKPHLPDWIPAEIRESAYRGKLPKDAKRIEGTSPYVVIWFNGYSIEAYQEYPSDFDFYLKVTHDDEDKARLLWKACTDFNREMWYFVSEKKLSPETARSEIFRIDNEIFKILVEGIVVGTIGEARRFQFLQQNTSRLLSGVRKLPRAKVPKGEVPPEPVPPTKGEGRGLFGKQSPPPTGAISKEIEELFLKASRSRWFRLKLNLYARLTGKGPINWAEFSKLVRGAEFREYASLREALQSIGYAGRSVKTGQLVLSVAKPIRRIPIIGKSAAQHELVHVYQELTSRTLSREAIISRAGGRLPYLKVLKIELAPNIAGGPAVLLSMILVGGGGAGGGVWVVYKMISEE